MMFGFDRNMQHLKNKEKRGFELDGRAFIYWRQSGVDARLSVFYPLQELPQ